MTETIYKKQKANKRQIKRKLLKKDRSYMHSKFKRCKIVGM